MERLAKTPFQHDRTGARFLGLKLRDYFGAFLDYAIALAKGDTSTMGKSVLQRLGPALLKEITDDMFNFMRYPEKSTAINATLIGAIIAAHQIRIAKDLSLRLGVGVASHFYANALQGLTGDSGPRVPPMREAESFLSLRAAFSEERGILPKIEGIKHAIALRRDPYLKALREHLHQFNSSLQTGRPDEVLEARNEIAKARKALQRKRSWEQALNWLTYLSVPLGVAETLLGGAPPVSIAVSILSAAGAAVGRKAQKANEWVLYGS